MSTRDAARTQRLREEDQRREMAVRRKPQAKKAKANNTVITLTAGMVIGCLLFWFLGSKGFLPVGGAPEQLVQQPAAGTAEPAPPVEAKRIKPEVDLSFYSKLPAGSAATQTIEPVTTAATGVPEFPEVTVEQPVAMVDPAQPVDPAAQVAPLPAPTQVDGVAVASMPQTVTQPVVSAQPVESVAVAPAPQPVAAAPAPVEKPAVVEKPVVKPEEKVAAKPEPAKQTSAYYLQVGTFKNMSAVETQRAQLAFSGVSASVRSGKDGSGQPIYRLVVGPFSSPQAAAPTKAKLATNGVSSFITR